jgi:hypothetical protein
MNKETTTPRYQRHQVFKLSKIYNRKSKFYRFHSVVLIRINYVLEDTV